MNKQRHSFTKQMSKYFPEVEIVKAQLWEKEQEEIHERKLQERSQTENNEGVEHSDNAPSETVIGGDREITGNRNGDVIFRNGNSHVNNGYEHTEM